MIPQPQIVSFSPAIFHFQDIVQGNTTEFRIAIAYDSDGTPYDLTGSDVHMDIRRADNSLVLALGIGNGIVITAPGEISVTISADDTEPLDPAFSYHYDLEIEKDGKIRTISWGTLKTLKQITQA
jgi:hypothetical protein